VAAALLAAGLGAGCAPSLRMVHRGNAYFERCYAADFDVRVRATDRHTCWVAWLDHYTVGQPVERVRYARARVAAIADEGGVAMLPGLPTAAVEGAHRPAVLVSSSEVVPAPEERGGAPGAGRASGVGSAPRGEPRAPAPAPTPAPVPPPPERIRRLNAACAGICEPRYASCLAQCDPARPQGCRNACASEHRACARACY
jgi:hypothetical protein